MRDAKCPRCESKFKDEHGVVQHLADVHGEGNRPRRLERYPLPDLEGEYEPRQFAAGAREDDY